MWWFGYRKVCDNGCGHVTGLQDVGKRILKEKEGSLTGRKDRRKRDKEKDVSAGVVLR